MTTPHAPTPAALATLIDVAASAARDIMIALYGARGSATEGDLRAAADSLCNEVELCTDLAATVRRLHSRLLETLATTDTTRPKDTP